MKAMPAVLRVSKENSKTVKSAAGVLYFVNRHWALRKGLLDSLNFKMVYPTNTEFVQYNGTIERV